MVVVHALSDFIFAVTTTGTASGPVSDQRAPEAAPETNKTKIDIISLSRKKASHGNLFYLQLTKLRLLGRTSLYLLPLLSQ